MESKKYNAFILRLKPSKIDRTIEGINENRIFIGWSKADGLIDQELSWEEFREIIHKTFFSDEKNYIKAGRSAGNAWRFIRVMEKNDIVIVPHKSDFYIAQILSGPKYDKAKFIEDRAYYRDVKWLNDKKPIPRKYARAALQSRMRIRHTCSFANDIMDDINDIINIIQNKQEPSLFSDFEFKLKKLTKDELLKGRLNPTEFENLIGKLLSSLGFEVISKFRGISDKGIDILCHYNLYGIIKLRIGVQIKWYDTAKGLINKNVVDELLNGMMQNECFMGCIITTGDFSDDTIDYVNELYQNENIFITLINGDVLASIIVNKGLSLID